MGVDKDVQKEIDRLKEMNDKLNPKDSENNKKVKDSLDKLEKSETKPEPKPTATPKAQKNTK